MSGTKPKGCAFQYPDDDPKRPGELCGDPVFACEKCSRHYAQDRRGKLGKTKEIASPGEGVRVDVCVTLDPDSLKKLDKRAKKLNLTRSEILDQFCSTLD